MKRNNAWNGSQCFLKNTETRIMNEYSYFGRVERKPELLEDLIAYGMKTLPPHQVYKLEHLQSNDEEYKRVEKMFHNNNRKYFSVEKIEKIHNPYLLIQYKIAKRKYKNKKEKLLFHGTNLSKVEDICKNNFNWRLEGTNRGHKYGKGISFSSFSYYATNYSDPGEKKVMILANVLIGRKCLGAEDFEIPPESYDTTTNLTECVIVKYDDNTFYPAYLISYNGIDPDKEDSIVRRPSRLKLGDFI